MPGQRLSHPEQSLSKKVTALSDFEFRVFEQVKLSSDDFGVMPYTSTILRADNLRLRKATEKQVWDAIQRIVTLALLLVFDHQDESYVCAPQWQKWQKINYPRTTHFPCPPAETIEQCNEETQHLFSIHPGGRKLPKLPPKHSGNVSEVIPGVVQENSGVDEASIPANANANANANASEKEKVIVRAPSLLMSPLEFARASEHCAFVGARLRVPKKLHADLRRDLGWPDVETKLQAWYAEVDEEIERTGESILPDVWKWLDARCKTWAAGSNKAVVRERLIRSVADGR